jgi:hypothetical protein
MSFVAMLAAWFQDHRHLAGRVSELERERRQRVWENLELAAHRVEGFAKRHGGRFEADSAYWIWVDLQGKSVGNQELAEIADDLVVVHKTGPPTPRFLALYGSQVTAAYAQELRKAAPSWRVITDRRLRRSDVTPLSSTYSTRAL